MTTLLQPRFGAPGRPGQLAARPLRLRIALFAAITILAASNVVSNRLWPDGYVGWNLAMAALLLSGARGCGLSWDDLGLNRARLRPGLALGGIVAAAVAALYAAALLLPVTRAAFLDSRAAGPLSAAVFAALIRIPLGTAVLEETAFRSVLPALVGGSWWRATLVSSGLFGLWHVLPAIGMASANAAIGSAVGSWGSVGEVTLAVLFTFTAGVAMCALRRRSGHLITTVLTHTATNSIGILAAWWLTST